MFLRKILISVALAGLCPVIAAATTPAQKAKAYSPTVNQPRMTQVYWGDTHLHTSLSLDAYTYNNKRLGPEQAYRFAKGETVITNTGQPAKLRRPLDFLVIADHASNMGAMQRLDNQTELQETSPAAVLLARKLQAANQAAGAKDTEQAIELFNQLSTDGFTLGKALADREQLSIWQRVARLADQHNQPGQFTAFIGFEWTQLFYNLHRVVIFKDSANKVGRVRPFSQYDSSDPEALWAYMNRYEQHQEGEVLAIPHNGNFSKGMMFALETVDGKPLSADYAKRRSRWEPLFEATQIKGDSETHPILSATDEFADYERIAVNEDSAYGSGWSEQIKKQRQLNYYDSWLEKKIAAGDPSWNARYGYARPALKLGLQQQARTGVNPFKFGMIGSTDSHTSLATADENNFWGKLSWVEPYPKRILQSWWGPGAKPGKELPGFVANAWHMNAAGYAAVWAEENTRESLFAAMKRKEVYASTGPRINVRFFGGWDFHKRDAYRPDLATVGYQKGVPMGGDLTQAPKGKAATFLIRAVKDPDGANLDRIQVVKGWHDVNGELHEKIYNVALSDDRKEKGPITEVVGNTVDIADASYTNTIGDVELSTVWKDPDFNPDELAFYYLRVLEIPTPRWTAYDAKYFQLKDVPEEVPMVTQERAYTSPIWYSP